MLDACSSFLFLTRMFVFCEVTHVLKSGYLQGNSKPVKSKGLVNWSHSFLPVKVNNPAGGGQGGLVVGIRRLMVLWME